MAKLMMPTISSPGCGMTGYASSQKPPPPLSAATTVVPAALLSAPISCAPPGPRSAREDERQGDAEDGQLLAEHEAEDRDGLQHTAGLGLTRHAAHVSREDQADAHAGA